jgi:hypothetical protein
MLNTYWPRIIPLSTLSSVFTIDSRLLLWIDFLLFNYLCGYVHTINCAHLTIVLRPVHLTVSLLAIAVESTSLSDRFLLGVSEASPSRGVQY